MHGMAHTDGHNAHVSRLAEVTMPDDGSTPVEREKHPVIVAQVDNDADHFIRHEEDQSERLNLNALSDDELMAEFNAAAERGDDAAAQRIFDEMGWREQNMDTPTGDAGGGEDGWLSGGSDLGHWNDQSAPEDSRVDDLVARGWDYLEAYAEVHDLNPEQLRRDEASSAVERGVGETLERSVRRQYDE
jgi:hypothetical protein